MHVKIWELENNKQIMDDSHILYSDLNWVFHQNSKANNQPFY